MVNGDFKLRVLEALKAKRELFSGSDKAFAMSIGTSAAQYSLITNGRMSNVIKDSQWIALARMLEVGKNGESWKTVETPTFITITAQLEKCQADSISTIFCDDADIGKTHAGRHYVKTHPNAIMVDCSQVKSKQELVRDIAKQFGCGHTGRYTDVYSDLVYYIANGVDNPLIILDEFADLNYMAMLECKALWNATEYACGWYAMGADGLKEMFTRGINNKKVGFTELFRRYGKRFQSITPAGGDEAIKRFTMEQAAMIIKANAPEGTDVKKMLVKTEGSLTRIRIEVSKAK